MINAGKDEFKLSKGNFSHSLMLGASNPLTLAVILYVYRCAVVNGDGECYLLFYAVLSPFESHVSSGYISGATGLSSQLGHLEG